jgi:hypothetical protein
MVLRHKFYASLNGTFINMKFNNGNIVNFIDVTNSANINADPQTTHKYYFNHVDTWILTDIIAL